MTKPINTNYRWYNKEVKKQFDHKLIDDKASGKLDSIQDFFDECINLYLAGELDGLLERAKEVEDE